MSDYVGNLVDRSFLHLMVIYVIHGVLLHVFLRPTDAHGGHLGGEFSRPPGAKDWRIFLESENTSYVGIRGNSNPRVEEKFNDGGIVNQVTRQVKSTGKLQFYKSSGSSFFTSVMCISVMGIMENISPGTWGIISGCIVFLLTFTENDNVR